MSQQAPESTLCVLEQIHSLPLPLEQARFRHYPGMKLGQLPQIAFFGEQLGARALEVLHTDPHHEWVMTAPPYHQLPAAANLLARHVHTLLQQPGRNLPLIEPRLGQQQIEIRSQEEFKTFYDYSKNSLQQRIQERQRLQQIQDADQLAPRFKNRNVIIINDIYVTGTQQQFLQQMFTQFQVHACYWFYIFQVESALAQAHPEIEHQINNSQITDLDSYAKVLADSDTRHTARSISRLFNEEIDNFSYVLARLPPGVQQHLYQLALKEGRYGHPMFQPKMQLLATPPGLLPGIHL